MLRASIRPDNKRLLRVLTQQGLIELAQLDLDKARASLGCFPGILPACVCKSATTFGISHKSRRPDETGTRLPLLMWQTGHQE